MGWACIFLVPSLVTSFRLGTCSVLFVMPQSCRWLKASSGTKNILSRMDYIAASQMSICPNSTCNELCREVGVHFRSHLQPLLCDLKGVKPLFHHSIVQPTQESYTDTCLIAKPASQTDV